MRQISLLDCTLRDGGFLNDWNFSKNTILSIFRRLVKANIDIIEIGFINENYCFDENRTINPDTKSFDKIFGNEKKGNSLIVAMIDLGTCSIDKISDKKESFIDGIRVIFKKKDMHSAINFCKQLQDKGYKISVQPVSITTYSDRDMLDLIDLVNELNPYAMSLVDTYGLLYKDRLLKYFSLLDNNLNSNISIGYHAHDNFKLSFANASELLRIQTRRKLIIDCSLYGMGKSAGNLNTELISDYLNKQYGKNYDILEIINAIELEILRFLKDCKWGYQLPLYVSAINECHPNYVKYLGTKNTISMKEISEIITEIDKDKRLSFNKEHIEQLYLKYQSKNLDDSKEYEKLSKIFKDKTILLIGPGNSVKKEQIKIKEYINKNNVITFGVNHINTIFDINYLFISNVKRYDQFIDFYSKNQNGEIIITNNIKSGQDKSDYILNYSSLINPNSIIGENSLYLLLKILIKLKVKKVVLAGFDGFSKFAPNYYDNNFQFFNKIENTDEISKAIIEQLSDFQKYIKIEFLTKSKYQNKELINV